MRSCELIARIAERGKTLDAVFFADGLPVCGQ